MSRFTTSFAQLALLLRVVCAVAALAALALLAPFDWRGHFGHVPASGGQGVGR